MIFLLTLSLIFVLSEGAATHDTCDQVPEIKVVESPPCYDACDPFQENPWILILRGGEMNSTDFEKNCPLVPPLGFDWNYDFHAAATTKLKLIYEKGFGQYGIDSKYFFMGLNKLHRYTSRGHWEVLFLMNYNKAPFMEYSIYDGFKVDEKMFRFTAHVGPRIYQHNNASDLLSSIDGNPFLVFDENGCAVEFNGGFWYSERCYVDEKPILIMSFCSILKHRGNPRSYKEFTGAVMAMRRVR